MIIRNADNMTPQAVEMEGCKDVEIRLLISDTDGAKNFFMRQFILAPQGHTPRHSHAWEHECYILAGEGKVLTPDGEVDVTAGNSLLIPCCDIHQFRNTGSAEMKFLCLIPKTDAQANDSTCCAGGSDDNCCGESPDANTCCQ